MEEEFLPYDLALAMKEIGFNEPCLGFYGGGFKDSEKVFELNNEDDATRFRKSRGLKAPLFQQAFKWFEKKQSIYANFTTLTNTNEILDTTASISSFRFTPIDMGSFLTKEEAELACLRKMIEIIQPK